MELAINLGSGGLVGFFCSDVSGAFDRVSADKLIGKLAACGVNSRMRQVIRSWLRDRTARVVVGGAESEEFHMSNIVFQGTVWGPFLWNVHFGDCICNITRCVFEVFVYADDCNAFRCFHRHVANDAVL